VNDIWQFEAFKTEDDYNNCDPFFLTIFHDYNEMKTFSANHCAEWREEYPDYCSNYFKWES
jgi:hypothetical protein